MTTVRDDDEPPEREEPIDWPGRLIMELLLEGPPLHHGAVIDDVACPACGGQLRADDRFELRRHTVGRSVHREPQFWSVTCTGCARCYYYVPRWRRLCSIREWPPLGRVTPARERPPSRPRSLGTARTPASNDGDEP